MARSRNARLLVLAAVLAGPVVLACNGIIGLSDFEKGDCPGARCGDASDIDVVVPEASPGADPVSWARWPMPNWPEAGVGTAPQFVAGPPGEITEDVTGLVWRAQEGGSKTYAEAQQYCRELAGGPWRVPKRIELVTLLDFGRGPSEPKIAPIFAGAKSTEVWTSSEVRPLVGSDQPYWVVDFNTGALRHKSSADNFVAEVRCVKGGK